jgi:NADH:ubiquinone oxidoreductase subunit 5 (subunit L)/multisubunit Na+/H+ antiporter MnhA subunit
VQQKKSINIPQGFQVSYVVNGVQQQSWPVAPGPFFGSFRSSQEANTVLDKFQLNTQVKCWYDPENPFLVVLEKTFHLQLFVAVLGFLLISFFALFFNKILYRNKNTPSVHTGITEGMFEIRENRYTTEYIYRGAEPITSDMLPKKLQKQNSILKQLIINKIKENGKYVSLKQPYARAVVTLMLLILLLLWFYL